MTHSDHQGPGRRALPAGEDGGETAAPRRGRAAESESEVPRRSSSGDATRDHLTGVRPWFRRRTWVAIVVLVATGLLVWAVLRSSSGPPQVIVPASASPAASGATPPSTASAPGSSAPATAAPSGSTAPLPGTVSPAPVPPASPEPTPAGSAAAGLVELNDARFTAPRGWTIYGDEMIEDARRAVRLRDPATEARLQAVTLEGGATELADACVSLVDLQQAQFTDVTRQLVVPIGVSATAGAGIRCGFTGLRSSDGVSNTVAFTLVSRVSDSHVLMLRATVPDTVASESAAVLQLGSMSCEASASFGVPLPLC